MEAEKSNAKPVSEWADLRFYDAHCHLADERLWDRRGDVLEAARRAGVAGLMVNGTGVGDWGRVAELAAEPGIAVSFGVHPWRLAEQPDGWREELVAYLDETPSAVGEVGLDGHLQVSLDDQVEAFLFQWRLSVERQLPVSVHCVKAFGQLLELIQAEGEHPVGFLLHGYGGSREMVQAFAGLGGYFSFGGPLTRNRQRMNQAAQEVPDNRLLLESDSPDQPPVAHEDATNEPAFLLQAANHLAELRDCSLSELAELTTANARRLFAASECTRM